MVSTYTPNLNLELIGTGDLPGTWGAELNTFDFTVVDTVLGGAQTFSLSSTDVTVTTTQSQNNAFLLTGALTGNVNIIFPSIGRSIYVANNTTGNFTVTLKTASAGVVFTLAQGSRRWLVLNGTDVLPATDADIGDVKQTAAAVAPNGWLLCYGQAISRTTYAALFGVISTTYGSGDGSTTFNVPDMRGRIGAGKDNMGGVAALRLQLPYIQGSVLGAVGGASSVTLTAAVSPVLSASVTIVTGGSVVNPGSQLGGAPTIYSASGGAGYTVLTIPINPTGGGPHSNIQPSIILNTVIFTGIYS